MWRVSIVFLLFGCPAHLLIPQSSVQRIASLSGLVLDTDGVAANANVHLYQVSIKNGVLTLFSACDTATDKTGRYDCHSLPPGRFLLAVSSFGKVAKPTDGDGQSNATISFYPSVADFAKAELITINGLVDNWADISIPETTSTYIKGTVVGASRDIALSLKAVSGGISFDTGIPVKFQPESGEFFAEGIPPGSYRLTADWFVDGGGHKGSVSFLVSQAPVEKLRISPEIDNTLSGAINAAPGKPTITSVELQLVDGSRPPVSTNVIAGNFRFAPIPPGKYILCIPAVQDSVVNSIVIGEKSSDSAAFVVPSQNMSHLEVHVQQPALSIRGIVQPWDTQNQTAEVIAQSETSGQIYQVITDKFRQFALSGLAPGTYRLFAWPGMDQIEYRNPVALKRYEDDSTEINIQPGGLSNNIEIHPIENFY